MLNNSVSIKISEFEKIPYIDTKNIGERVLTTLSFYDENKWHFWLPTHNGLIKMIGEPSESDYFSRVREKETDIYFDFLNFIIQRASWPEVMHYIDGIRNDLHNLGASLGKLSLFHRCKEDTNIEVRRFVSTEIEYIFGVCRSMFDLLQEVIATLWMKRIILVDKNIKKKQLKSSFAKMVLSNNKLMNEGEIEKKFNLPVEMASFYCRHGAFFQVLRQYRDNILHRGTDFNLIFITERGFAVCANEEPFSSFGVWNEKHMLPNRLASLRPVVAYVISKTLEACEDFSCTIQRIIRFPPEISPGFKLLVRGYHNHELLAMKNILANCLWWEDS